MAPQHLTAVRLAPPASAPSRLLASPDMRTLETDVQVGADGSLKLLVPLPAWLKPGRRHIVLVVEEAPGARAKASAKTSAMPSKKVNAKRSNPVDALRKIARKGGVGIKDPVAWQRAERRDRPLPGRA